MRLKNLSTSQGYDSPHRPESGEGIDKGVRHLAPLNLIIIIMSMALYLNVVTQLQNKRLRSLIIYIVDNNLIVYSAEYGHQERSFQAY